MAEEQKIEQPGVEPQDNLDSAEKESKEKTFTQAELDEIIEKRLARERKKLADASSKLAEYDEIKKRLAELEAEKEEQRRAELTEAERLQEELKAAIEAREQLQKQLEATERRVKEQAIDAEFIQYATKHGIAYIEDARKLADLGDIEFDENGKPVGIEDRVKLLVKEKPFLLGEKKTPLTIGDSNNPNPRPDKTKEQRLKEAAEKARSGRPEDVAAYSRLKRELGLV